jgi:hypothetical protein
MLSQIKPSNRKTIFCYLLGAALLSACGDVFAPPEARAATETASVIDGIAAQTLEALRSGVDADVHQSPEAEATHTALPATRTPLPSSTPWPDPVRIQVSVDTNCRSGPGPGFPLIGALMVGESTIVRARVPEIDYWLVENPDNPGRECWLWGKHATLDGTTNHLPLVTPPWTPTPEPGTIAGWVYIDSNNNRTRDDPGDTPLSGITINVRVGACPGGTSAAMVETDAEGRYLVSNLIPTLYCLSRPASEPLNPNTWTINLRPGQVRDEINFWQMP